MRSRRGSRLRSEVLSAIRTWIHHYRGQNVEVHSFHVISKIPTTSLPAIFTSASIIKQMAAMKILNAGRSSTDALSALTGANCFDDLHGFLKGAKTHVKQIM